MGAITRSVTIGRLVILLFSWLSIYQIISGAAPAGNLPVQRHIPSRGRDARGIGECRTLENKQREERLKPRAALLAKRPPAREQDPKQPIPTTEARATSSAALENGDFDGAARWLPTPPARLKGNTRLR